MVRSSMFAIALVATALLPSSGTPVRTAPLALPPLMLWAWERPEDFRGMDADVGVAFLAQTVTVRGNQIVSAARRQPLRVDPRTRLVAVTRLEVDHARPAGFDAVAIAAQIVASSALPRVVAVQIDFDATKSERVFYRALLHAVRERLDPSTALSITALASWCASDAWLEDLPIDEAVPMLFEMGPEHDQFRGIAGSRSRAAPKCRGAVGWSTAEPIDIALEGRRAYVFNPKPWTPVMVAEAQREARR